jgi:hypothetical protein
LLGGQLLVLRGFSSDSQSSSGDENLELMVFLFSRRMAFQSVSSQLQEYYRSSAANEPIW